MPKLTPNSPSTDAAGGKMPARQISFMTLGVFALVLLTAAGLKLKNSLNAPVPTSAPEVAAPANVPIDDTASLLEKLGRHIVLREEAPTVATVQDPEILRGQNNYFYKDAKVGDRVLAWSDKVVLYSPDRDLILAVLPINIVTPSSTAQNPEAKEVASVEVRNGSGTVGLGRAVSTELQAEGYDVASVSDASVKTYTKTVIFNASGKDLPQTVQALATKLKAEVITELSAEKNLKGDILVVVGSEYKQ